MELANMKIEITVLETGRVRIRPSMLQQPAERSVLLRRLRFLIDREWTEWMPVYVFLIHHPEGYILFDTGMSPSCNDWGYFPLWMPTFRLTSEIQINENEGIRTQLHDIGIEPDDLKAIVISHLHYDHSGGLPDLVGAPVFMMEDHWNAFKFPIKATLEGATPNHWPKDFSPKFLQPTGPAIGPFERSYPITSDGKIVAVETPGHVPGHLSLIVFSDDATFFLAADATYRQDLLDQELTDGVNDDPLRAVESLRKIKELASQLPLVILPAHDPEVLKRKADRLVYKPTKI